MIEVLKQMTEALEDITRLLQGITGGTFSKLDVAIQAGRQAIAELESQEPAQKPMHPDLKRLYEDYFDKHFKETIDSALYTHPPQRPWVGLTDEEIWTVLQFRGYNTDTIEIARAIEQALKEKNT
jgi:hypothetical protein